MDELLDFCKSWTRWEIVRHQTNGVLHLLHNELDAISLGIIAPNRFVNSPYCVGELVHLAPTGKVVYIVSSLGVLPRGA